MTATLKPYPAYKDSGVPWLGKVPEGWEMRRTKTLLRERVQKGFPNEQMLAATQTKGVVRKEQYENRTVLALKDLHLLKLVRRGDFVISLRSFQGGIEYAREQGIISPAYTVLYTIDASHHGYLAHLFKSKPYIENLTLHVTGIRQGQNIDYEKLARALVPLPPPAEQDAIVRFLDHQDRLIRKYIESKEKLIALLTEQKQAIIQRAVTRGLNPDLPAPSNARQAGVKLKPSGACLPRSDASRRRKVDWLGDIPEHWEVRRLRIIVDLIVSNVDKIITAGQPQCRLCNYVDAYKNERITKQITFMHATASQDEIRRFRIRRDDVLITKDSEEWNDIGVPSLVEYEASDLVCGYHLGILRPRANQIKGSFLLRSLQCHIIASQLHIAANGVTRYGLSQGAIKNVAIPLPSISEQEKIIETLETQLEPFETAQTRARRQITLMREYRTRLISDVVTGKVDVSTALNAGARDAAALPDEAVEAATAESSEDQS